MRSFAPKGKKWIQSSDDIWIMPSEFYILVWNQKDMAIRLYDYAELSVKSDFKIKSLGYGVSPDEDDEIAAKHYKHEIASGKPDKKYQNNPMRVEVFRGFISITVGKNRAKVDFKNKKYAVLTEKRINSYKKSIPLFVEQKLVDYTKGEVLLVFSCSHIPEGFDFSRIQRAKLTVAEVSGLRVPSSSVRVLDDGQTIVYIIKEGICRPRNIKILFEKSGYCVVAEAQTKSDLELYDRIITGDKNLYDGKVIDY
jgi:hypothetical protein